MKRYELFENNKLVDDNYKPTADDLKNASLCWENCLFMSSCKRNQVNKSFIKIYDDRHPHFSAIVTACDNYEINPNALGFKPTDFQKKLLKITAGDIRCYRLLCSLRFSLENIVFESLIEKLYLLNYHPSTIYEKFYDKCLENVNDFVLEIAETPLTLKKTR